MVSPQLTAPLAAASRSDSEDSDVEMTPARRAAEHAVDELSSVASHRDSDRLDAFESARKKFAMYGKQNDHVSHYSPDKHQAVLERNRQRAMKRKGGKGSSASAKGKGPSPVRRAVEWDEADTTNTVVLKNTLLLQENGELAAQLDDIEYHLDGILETNTSSSISSERGYTMAQSVVALTRLLQEEQVQAVLKVASHRRQIYARLRGVLLMLQTANHRMLTLAIAVMAFILTHSADADDYFQEPVIDAVVVALRNEAKRLGVQALNGQQPHQQVGDGAEITTETKTPLKKSFLKRKKSTAPLHRALSAVRESVFGMDEVEEGVKADSSKTQALQDEKIQKNLREILRGHDAFAVDGAVQLSLADLLGMILHNILQVGGATMATSSGDNDERSFRKSAARPRLHQRQEQAGTMFATILQRKQQLLRNHGLDVLLTLLANRVDRLHNDLEGDLLQASVSLDLASAFQRVRTTLRVLDQASFLARDVQVHMSKDPMIFSVTLQLVEKLSCVAWSRRSRRKWRSDPSFMYLVVDVLLASLRVLINLSHQNDDANQHLAKLSGTQVLFFAFCRLWGSSELDQGAKHDKESREAEDKVIYDALLLILSAITNCVEYSEENRALLSQIDLSKAALEGLEAFKASSVCSLLVAFFVSKIKSYVHLIEMSESQRDFEEEAWIPEDVILGGCTSLLLGCLMKDSSYNSAIVLGALPDGSPRLLLRALSAFVALHSQIGALTPEVGKSVLEVEQVLKSFSFDGNETMPSLSPAYCPRNKVIEGERSGSNAIRGQSPLATRNPNVQDNDEATLTIKVTMTPVKRKMRRADVEEIDEDGDEIVEESQLSQASQLSVRSPPASAFKLQRFMRVCSNVDDSDDLASDLDPSPVKKKRSVPTPKSQSRPENAKMVVKATVTMTPSRPRVVSSTKQSDTRPRALSSTKPSDVDNQGDKLPTQRRLKRTRQLVSDLEAEFMKIGTRSSNEINTAGAMTSTEDTGDGLDFSQDLALSLSAVTPVKKIRRVKSATPASATAKKRRVKSTTPATATAKNVRVKSTTSPAPTTGRRNGTPPVTQKRKTKATPPKSAKKAPAKKSATNESVFDFPG